MLGKKAIGWALPALLLIYGATFEQPAHAADISFCSVKSNFPHPSTHVNGTINAVGTISCDRKMVEIYLRTTLVKTTTGASWAGSVFNQFGVRSGNSNAATSCTQDPASFQTKTYYSITFPSPLTPSHQSGWLNSSIVSVVCGANRIAGLTSDDYQSPYNGDKQEINETSKEVVITASESVTPSTATNRTANGLREFN